MMKKTLGVFALAFLLIPVMGILAGGQGQSDEAGMNEAIELTYWGWGPHVEAVNNEIGPAFTALYPNVTVKGIAMGPWDLMDKFYTSIVTGQGAPDVSILVRRVIEKYLIPELLYDFTDFVQPQIDEFPPSLIGDVTSVDGRILAIPDNYGPSVMYYDKKLATRLNVDVGQIRTWDDYLELAIQISKDHPDVYVHPHFYPAGSWGSNQWRLYAMSSGGNIYDSDDRVIRDNTLLSDVTQFYYRLNTEVNVAPGAVNDPFIYDQLRNRNLLFWPSNSYRAMEIAQQAPEMKGELDTFPWPLWSEDGPKLAGVWGGQALVVPKNGPNAEIAAEFAQFYATNQVALTKLWFSTTGVPAYRSVRDEIMAMADQETFALNLMESIAARETQPWNFVDWAQTEKIIGDALDAMFAGDRAPEDTWPYVEGQLIKILGR